MNRKKTWIQIGCTAAVIIAVAAHYIFEPWGFYRKVSQSEAEKRLSAKRLSAFTTAQGMKL